jgi:hypothetical protein
MLLECFKGWYTEKGRHRLLEKGGVFLRFAPPGQERGRIHD